MGYLHGVKPKMTGGLKQEDVGISPEAHSEWKDKAGKHTIDAGIAEAPASLAGQEKVSLTKNENPEKQSNQISAGAHVGPNKRGSPHPKSLGKAGTILKKAVKTVPGGAGKVSSELSKSGFAV